MKTRRSPLSVIVLMIAVAMWAPAAARAQETSEGVNSGNYNVRHSVEFGYRWTDFTGNQDVFDTFVNLHQGPRLVGHTLEMRSLNQAGSLFDDLFLNSFGYGGDPNNLSMLRVSENKWYNFSGTFRRNRTLWNYNLLANPLNPVLSNPSVPIVDSPHAMRLSRRMSDLNLTLLPQSRLRFRLGYTRNISEGPSFTSFHEGTDVLLFQDWKQTVNSYHMGVDFRVSPRTNISYDQFLHYYKGDKSYVDQNLTYQLADGTPVDLGLIFDTANNSPCAAPIINAASDPPTVDPTCNGYLFYERYGPVRTRYPTQQLSFQSSSVKNLDVAGRFVYSTSNTEIPVFSEFFQGLVTRTRQREFSVSGPAEAKRISVSADLAATYSFTPKFRVVDEFRFWDYRIPGQWAFSELSLFGRRLDQPAAVFDPATCPPPYTAATCPPHNSSSPADVISGVSSLFLGQDTKLNTIRLEYDLNRRIGGRLGYRYRHRTITQREFDAEDLVYYPSLARRGACGADEPLEPDGSCHISEAELHDEDFVINEHSLLLGIWSRPFDGMRITYDTELMSADNVFTRISPRQFQRYKLRASYRPTRWMNLGGSLNIYEARNNATDIDHLQHSRSYGFNATMAPTDRWALDMGYDYNNIFSHTNICYSLGFGPAPPGSTPCPVVAPGVASIAAVSTYDVTTDYAYSEVMVKPVKQLVLNFGYAMNTVNGETLILNPNAFPGPLQSTFRKPYASVAIDVYKGWTWKAAYGFYNYREQAYFGDATAPRSFRGNLLMISLRYIL